MRPAALALVLCGAGAAAAQPEIRDDDRARLDAFDASVGPALLAVLAEGSDEDVALLTDVLSGAALEPAEIHPEGEWACRTIKLGGVAGPMTAYQPFRCRIMAMGEGTWRFEKLTGSQLTTGTLFERSGEVVVYAGTGYVTDEAPVAYDELPEPIDPQATPQRVLMVGVFEQVGDGAARLMLPEPLLESEFHILVLSR